MNLAEGILQERDRLIRAKEAVGDMWNIPEFFFIRAVYDDLMKRSEIALAGKMEATAMIKLYTEMKE